MTGTPDRLGTEANQAVLKLIPPAELKRVLEQPHADIDLEFIGFMDQYVALSYLIPKHFTVVDLGCGYNPQSYLFTGHKRYIAVDAPMPSEWGQLRRFCAPNCELFEMTISEFIDKHIGSLDLDETFAICNYVPPWHGHDSKKVGATFKNVFCYYPSDKTGQNQMHRNIMQSLLAKGITSA
jgi:hypothetical protein